MPRRPAELPSGVRLSDFISLGVLARTFPVEAVRRVLEQCGKSGQRQRDLPSFLVVYYVIALALYRQFPHAKSCVVYWKAGAGCGGRKAGG